MATRTVGVRLTADASDLRSGLQAASRSVGGFTSDTSRAFDIIASRSTLMAAGVVAATFAIVKGYQSTVAPAIEFEAAMRNTNSIMHLSEGQFQRTSDLVLNMSKSFPQAAAVMARGLYDIASAGFVGRDATTVLGASVKAASAGMTDTSTAAKAITSVLRAYGLQASDAGHVSDVLFQTVNLGIITFEELAQNLGDVVGIAAAAKISIGDIGAAIAAITLSGVPAAESTTSLNRLIQSMIQPGKALTSVFRSWGYETGLAAVQALGLNGVMERLRKETGGNVASMLALFPELRAARAAFALSAADGKNYAETQAQIGDAAAVAGATQKAFAEQMKSTENRLKLASNQAAAFGIGIGRSLLPAINAVAKGLSIFTSGLATGTRFMSEHRALVAAVAIAYATRFIPLIFGAQGALRQYIATLVRSRIEAISTAVETQGLGAAMGGLALQLGVMAGIAFGALIVKQLNDAKNAAQGFVTTLQQGLDLSTDQGASQYGKRLSDSLQDILDTRTLVGESGGRLSGIFNKDTREATATVDALSKELELLSIKHLNVADNIQHIADVTNTHGKGASDRLKQFAKLAGADLSGSLASSKGERQKVIDYMDDLSKKTGVSIDVIGALGPAFIDSMQQAEQAAEQAMGKLSDFFGLIQGFEFPDASKAAKDSTDAANALADAQDRLASAQDKVAENQRHSIRTPKLDRELAAAVRERAKAEQDAADARKKADDARSNAKDPATAIAQQYSKQITAFTGFLSDIDKAASMGLDAAFLLQAMQNPKDYAPILHAIVSDRSGKLVRTVNKSEGQLRDLATRSKAIIAMLTDSVNQGIYVLGDVVVGGIHKALTDPRLKDLDQLAWQVGAGIRGSLAGGLQGKGSPAPIPAAKPATPVSGPAPIPAAKPATPVSGAPSVETTTHGGKTYYNIGQGIWVDASHVPTWFKKQHPDVTFRAMGGVDAHIASGTSIVYGEQGTGGEAFIPLGPAHRGRSTMILADVARRFGMGVMPMQFGGVLYPSGSNGGTAGPISHTNQNIQNFNGDIRVHDPAEFEKWSDRRQRLNALLGAM